MKKLKEIYNIENEQAIREYMGISKEIYDKFWDIWKPKIKEIVVIAKKHNAEYIFETDYDIYITKLKRKPHIIDTLYGITIFKERGTQK